jgi:pilus assembly protein CpaB
VTKASRRRRAVLLLALALAAGGLTASQVRGSVEEIESRVGAPVPVVVAAQDIGAGARFDPGKLERMLTVHEVPERFVPPGSLGAAEEAMGLRSAVPIAADSYVTAGHLDSGVGRAATGPVLGPGERVVEIAVAGGEALGATGPGGLVDVVVTTGGDTGGGRSYVALQSVELVDLRSGAAGGSSTGTGDATAGGGGTVAALRVTLQQAVMLTAAQNFAREIRLLARSPSDRKKVGPTSTDASDL